MGRKLRSKQQQRRRLRRLALLCPMSILMPVLLPSSTAPQETLTHQIQTLPQLHLHPHPLAPASYKRWAMPWAVRWAWEASEPTTTTWLWWALSGQGWNALMIVMLFSKGFCVACTSQRVGCKAARETTRMVKECWHNVGTDILTYTSCLETWNITILTSSPIGFN